MSLFHVERNPGQLTNLRRSKGTQKPCYCSQTFGGKVGSVGKFGSRLLFRLTLSDTKTRAV